MRERENEKNITHPYVIVVIVPQDVLRLTFLSDMPVAGLRHGVGLIWYWILFCFRLSFFFTFKLLEVVYAEGPRALTLSGSQRTRDVIKVHFMVWES